MPILAILVAAALLATPAAATPVSAHHSKAAEHGEFAQATKQAKKATKKPKARPKKKEEYLRAVPVR